MKFIRHSLPVFFLFVFFTANAQCPPGFDSVRLEINADDYYSEVFWQLSNQSGSVIYDNGYVPDSGWHTFEYCVPQADGCKKFVIYDAANDGMFPDGIYRLYVNGELLYESIGYIGASETVHFGCAPGTDCNSALTMNLGSTATPDGNETWYRFVPVDTGIYAITTCDAVCDTKIWVYDRCQGIIIADDQTGAIYYAYTGCPSGRASAIVNLAGGKEYYVRIRYKTPGCSTDSIPFSVTYVGQITGCTDPTACNYEPLATIADTNCIYPGDPDCPQAPDLEVNQSMLLSSLTFETLNNPDPCTVQEGCLRGLGNRDIISFSTHIRNIGDVDYYIGPPPADINEPSSQFVYDPCHGHWHYLGYADYLLFNSEGLRVPIGSKTGFCVLDLECTNGGFGNYDCLNMGISAGCGDIYSAGLPCQWIDITELPADAYTLVVRVNWDKSPDVLGRVEKRYDNNWAQACFTLSYLNGVPDVVFSQDSCLAYADCAGEVFGPAQPDCNGICNGPALFGDLNQDTLRNTLDVEAYLATALTGNVTANHCSDLYEDAQINVYDAALLQECNLYAEDQSHWIQRFPCQFPTGFNNTLDVVTLLPGTLDTVAKTFVIQIKNPLNKILAYEFSVSGLNMTSVDNLAPEFNATPAFDAATGKIIALAANESAIKKNLSPAPFIRVHYDALTANEVCVASVTAVVNNKYQLSNASLGTPNCVPVTFVATNEPDRSPFAFYVQPNPMSDRTTIFFDNENEEPVTLTLRDLTGRTLRTIRDVRNDFILLDRNGLPQGTYFFTLQSTRGSASGKVVME